MSERNNEGKWLTGKGEKNYYMKCSECSSEFGLATDSTPNYEYCPFCGAKMTETVKEEDYIANESSDAADDIKVGDKYVVEIGDIFKDDFGGKLYSVKGFKSLVFDRYGIEKLVSFKDEMNDVMEDMFDDVKARMK